ncbi:MAG: hypothetical protein A2Y78_13715 [Acidobacteria bacterium RBG_13_68_16]|nr:MAG: hypothetical protein A2Y78_13715 [Acidobacteria bacterium RBG_13_68_16]
MAGRDRLPLALVLAFWAALYLPHLLKGDTLPARDVAATQLPWRTVWREQVLAGSPPLWDPYSSGGRPLLANPNTMAVYPGTLLFLLTSPECAAAWHIALHHLLLIVGCYRLARRTGAAPPGAAVATAATATCGVVWSSVTFLNFQASLTWAVWALASAVPPPTPGRPAVRRALLGGTLVGLSFLGGEPVTAAVAALAWAAVVLSTWRPLPVAPLVVMPASAVALAAPVLVPLLVAFPETVRGTLGPAALAIAADALAPRRFLELFAPNLLGPPLADLAGGFWAAPSFPWQRYYPVIFLGAAPLLCLPFARRAGRRLAPWWAMALAGLVGAAVLAPPAVAAVARNLPLLGAMRYAIKLLVLTVMALPPLLAAGWEGLVARWERGARRWVRTLALITVVLAPAAIAPDRLLRPILAALYPASRTAASEVPTATLRRAALLDWAALLVPPAVLALAGPVPVAAAGAVLVANVTGGAGVLLFADSAAWAQPPPAMAALPPRPTLAPIELPGASPERRSGPPLGRFWELRLALVPEYGARWGAAYVLTRGPDGLEPVRQELLAAASASMALEDRARLAQAVGATAVIARAPVTGRPVAPAGALWISGVDRPSPRVYLAKRIVPAEGTVAAATALAAASFRPGEDAVVAGARGVQESGGGEVTELIGRPHHRLFDVTAAGSGLLVVQQSFMRGWRATVDGRPASVEVANGANIGVRVPAGRHRVALFLDPTPYRAGLVGPILLLLAAGFIRWAGTSRDRAAAIDDEGHSTPATPPAR